VPAKATKAAGRKRKRGQSPAAEAEAEGEGKADAATSAIHEEPTRAPSPLEAVAASLQTERQQQQQSEAPLIDADAVMVDAQEAAPKGDPPNEDADADADADVTAKGKAAPSTTVVAETQVVAAIQQQETTGAQNNGDDNDEGHEEGHREEEEEGEHEHVHEHEEQDEDEDGDVTVLSATSSKAPTQLLSSAPHGPSSTTTASAAAFWAKMQTIRPTGALSSQQQVKRGLFSSNRRTTISSSQAGEISRKVEGFPEFREDPEIAARKKARREAKAAQEQADAEERAKAFAALRASGSGGNGNGGYAGPSKWPISSSVLPQVTNADPDGNSGSGNMSGVRKGNRIGNIPIPQSWDAFHQGVAVGGPQGGQLNHNGFNPQTPGSGSGGSFQPFSVSRDGSGASASGGGGFATPARVPDPHGFRTLPAALKQHVTTSHFPSPAVMQSGAFVLLVLTLSAAAALQGRRSSSRAVQVAAMLSKFSSLPIVAVVLQPEDVEQLDADEDSLAETGVERSDEKMDAREASRPFPVVELRVRDGESAAEALRQLIAGTSIKRSNSNSSSADSDSDSTSASSAVRAHAVVVEESWMSGDAVVLEQLLKKPTASTLHCPVYTVNTQCTLPLRAIRAYVQKLNTSATKQALTPATPVQTAREGDEASPSAPQATLVLAPPHKSALLEALLSSIPAQDAALVREVCGGMLQSQRFQTFATAMLSKWQDLRTREDATTAADASAQARHCDALLAAAAQLLAESPVGAALRKLACASAAKGDEGGEEEGNAALGTNAKAEETNGEGWALHRVHEAIKADVSTNSASYVPASAMLSASSAVAGAPDASQAPTEPEDLLRCLLRDYERFVIFESTKKYMDAMAQQQQHQQMEQEAPSFLQVACESFPFAVAEDELHEWFARCSSSNGYGAHTGVPVPPPAADIKAGTTSNDPAWNTAINLLRAASSTASASAYASTSGPVCAAAALPYLAARFAHWHALLLLGAADASHVLQAPTMDIALQLLLPLGLGAGLTEIEVLCAVARGVEGTRAAMALAPLASMSSGPFPALNLSLSSTHQSMLNASIGGDVSSLDSALAPTPLLT
jgi:hypothetical protein